MLAVQSWGHTRSVHAKNAKTVSYMSPAVLQFAKSVIYVDSAASRFGVHSIFKQLDKFQFVDYLKIIDCRAGACSCRQNKTERASPFPTNPTLKQLDKLKFELKKTVNLITLTPRRLPPMFFQAKSVFNGEQIT